MFVGTLKALKFCVVYLFLLPVVNYNYVNTQNKKFNARYTSDNGNRLVNVMPITNYCTDPFKTFLFNSYIKSKPRD